MPAGFLLHDSVPNPFNPMTVIKYDLPVASRVSLKILDVSGRLVTVLKYNVLESVGWNAAVWDGRDGAGRMVSAGVYLYRLEAGEYQKTKGMTLIK